MKISVILPNYNHGPYLNERIESILSQIYQNFELIILDDCSTDNSKEIIESFRCHPRVAAIIYNHINSGTTFRQWEKGLALAKGELVWLAESDDYAHSEFLTTAVKVFEQHPSVGLFYSDSHIVSDNNWGEAKTFSTHKNKIFKTDKWDNDYLVNGCEELNSWLKYYCIVNNASAAVFRKDLAVQVMEEVAGYKYSGDWIFYIKMAALGDVYYCSKALNYYREHDKNFSIKSFSDTRQQKDFFRIQAAINLLPCVTNKKDLLPFFMTQYCDVGIRRFGFFRFLGLVGSYLKTDFKLGMRAILFIFKKRIRRALRVAQVA